MKFLFMLTLLLVFSVACKDIPRAELSETQRLADMMWLITKVEAEYAPLKYKEEKHKFNFEEISKNYLDQAKEPQTNEEFYQLMMKFVATFQDAHMSASLSRSSLAGRSKVAYLGFTGERKGDVFLVKSFLPTFASGAVNPLKADDEILQVDGVDIKEAVKNLLTPYRNLGNMESNYTALMRSLFIKSSVNFPLPTTENIVLKIKRDKDTFEVKLPWIIKDYSVYAEEQAKAVAKKSSITKEEEAEVMQLINMSNILPYYTEGQMLAYLGRSKDVKEFKANFLSFTSSLKPTNSFEFQLRDELENINRLSSLVDQKFDSKNASIVDDLKKQRFVPKHVMMIESAKNYPAYIATITKDGKRHNFGYIRLSTFSPEGTENMVLEEFKKTLLAFRDYGEKGVDHVVIDLINNGGGSLSLGLKLAQLLTSEKIKQPSLTTRLNDSWVDQFEAISESEGDDTRSEIARRILNSMLEALSRGEKMSPAFTTHDLYPYRIQPNSDLVIDEKPFKFKLVLVVNEMCASMCDIFTSTLKDNKMAHILGQQTMGAGGNVVNHFSAPHSGLTLNITESLIISPNGDFLENQGVKPDVEINVSAFSDKKYEDVLVKAFDMLIDLKKINSALMRY